ncbi:porin [Massilia sp. TS11]|uniref:porin n=1 Tax=Massilia sp. TS11 TaxID=2908003 RepID=UPI001EDC6FF2|nr:porin [Massilia sp. TS11]MCG2585878.1 porin [Massilia sp. TS11]
MKTQVLAAALAAAFAAAPALALANDSSIQIYGIADAGFVKTAGAPLKLASGIADGSRIGFKGTEDMGGGYKAIFNLEARVEMDTGKQSPTLVTENQGYYLTKGMSALPAAVLAGVRSALQPKGGAAVNPENAIFDRTSMVGLITPFGAVLLGRMYTPGYEVFNSADVFESGTAGTWGGITGGSAGFQALGADIRSQKSVQWRVAVDGIGAALMYGTKGSGYLGRYNKFTAANLTYKKGPWDVGVGYNRGYDQNDNVSLTTTTIGGSYSIDNWKLFFGFHDQKNQNSVLLKDYIAGWDSGIAPLLGGATSPTQLALRNNVFVPNITRNSQIDANSVQVGFHYRIGAGRVMASLARQNDRSVSNSDATQYAVGYDYFLSKRTDVYTVLGIIKNTNDAQYAPSTAGAPGGFTAAPGETGRSIQIGIRHKF